jgi:hypothetical protein
VSVVFCAACARSLALSLLALPRVLSTVQCSSVFVGSGRFVTTIENWLMRFALPFYSNTHTETSSCGLFTGELREDARNVIRVGLLVFDVRCDVYECV